VDNSFARLNRFVKQVPSGRIATTIATVLILSVAAVVWAPHLPHSLWLDETLTFWVVKDGLWDAVTRGVQFQSQPAYYILIWFWTQAFGTSETVLRLPSLLAVLVACAALARLGTRLTGDREFGSLAAVVFATTAIVFREAVDARSYALGTTLLVGLAISLVSWLDHGRWRDAWCVGVLAGVTPHFHVFFALTYPAFILYGAMRSRSAPVRLDQAALIGALLTVAAALSIPAALTLLANRGSYSFAPMPSPRNLLTSFVWAPPVAGLLAGLCVDGMSRKSTPETKGATATHSKTTNATPTIKREVGTLLSVWALTPLLILYFASTLTGSSIFLDRYLITCLPAVSLLYAIPLRRIDSGAARGLAMIVIALTCLVSYARPVDNFRGAALAVNRFVAADESVPVLLASGLIESQDENWLRDPALAAYLTAPTAYYPLDGNVISLPRKLPLPREGHSQERRIGDEIVEPILRENDRFAAIEWTGNGANVMPWLIARAERAGYRRIMNRRFGSVHVVCFRRLGADREKP
jgi:4-amino-4-deoxy-L-arabinose transferase-like glycosyltransferase